MVERWKSILVYKATCSEEVEVDGLGTGLLELCAEIRRFEDAALVEGVHVALGRKARSRLLAADVEDEVGHGWVGKDIGPYLETKFSREGEEMGAFHD